MRHKPFELDWISLTAAGVAGTLTGVGSTELGFAEKVALGITVGLTTAVVLHIAIRVLGGRRRR